MAAGQIYNGTNVRLSYEGKVLYHTTACKLQISSKLEEIATKDTAGSVVTPGNYAWTVTAEALVADKPSGSTTQIGAMDIVDYQLAKTALDIEFTSGVAGDWKYAGSVYVESADIDATVDQSMTGSFSFKGNGDLTKSIVPSPNPTMTSSDTIAIENGVADDFQVTATNGPLTSFGITGANSLPTNVSLNTTTGLISWTSSVTPGTYTVELQIFNSSGWTTETITFNVS
jgi:hypothetical protein